MQKGSLMYFGGIIKVYADGKRQKFHMLNLKRISSFAHNIVFW